MLCNHSSTSTLFHYVSMHAAPRKENGKSSYEAAALQEKLSFTTFVMRSDEIKGGLRRSETCSRSTLDCLKPCGCLMADKGKILRGHTEMLMK